MNAIEYEIKRSQHGMVLVIALLFLLVMTLLGTAAMQSSVQQEKLAANRRDSDLAFQAAEAALRAAERYIISTVVPNNIRYFNSDADAILPPQYGLVPPGNDSPSHFWTNYFNNPNNPVLYLNNTSLPPTGSLLSLSEVAQQPKYIIEDRTEGISNPEISGDQECAQPTTKKCFRITAWGMGGSTNTIVILQSTFVVD